jgi:hypothetical protein
VNGTTEIELHRAYPHRWGPGKVHASGGSYRDSLCADHLHGSRERGTVDDVDCKRCRRELGLPRDRAA